MSFVMVNKPPLANFEDILNDARQLRVFRPIRAGICRKEDYSAVVKARRTWLWIAVTPVPHKV